MYNQDAFDLVNQKILNVPSMISREVVLALLFQLKFAHCEAFEVSAPIAQILIQHKWPAVHSHLLDYISCVIKVFFRIKIRIMIKKDAWAVFVYTIGKGPGKLL